MNKIGRTKEIPRIIVPQGAQKHIASHFGVSGETVRRALKYIINTELAVRIREEAIKNYGGAESIIRVKIQIFKGYDDKNRNEYAHGKICRSDGKTE